MRESRRYVVFVLILALLCGLKFADTGDSLAQMGSYQNQKRELESFYPMQAAQINRTHAIHARLDGEKIAGVWKDIVLNSQMQLMVSTKLIPDLFGAHVSAYADGRIRLLRGKDQVTLFRGQLEGIYNQENRRLSQAPILERGLYYLPLQDMADWWDYRLLWDQSRQSLSIESQGQDRFRLPSRFDLRQEDMVSEIRDQGSAAECWADAAIGALESSLLPQNVSHYSVEDMVQNNAFGIDPKLGGDYIMASSHMLSWAGPKRRGDMAVDRHVQGVRFLDQNSISNIKRAVYEHGGVTSSLYVDIEGADISAASFYSARNNAYCYRGKNRPNHDVIIIGWDDNYKASNFSGYASENGAWICQNSWGKNFGEKGIFYVSYEDSNIGSQSVSYADVEPASNYQQIFQSDRMGWIGQVGYGNGQVMGANVYHTGEELQLEAAGFYALAKNTSYQIYVVNQANGSASLDKRTLVASGRVEQRGYYTIPFDQAQSIAARSNFAIVVALDSPGLSQPMAIEYRTGDYRTAKVDISDGEGYLSRDGKNWEHVEQKMSANLCIKAYGNPLPATD